mmetsp:Transcript_6663/g.19751  ORF Transcript_6663/g.19751 Transcript_6663/m.19751 type:complete len:513 (-) Transcript_6663:2198-3736(-)
MSLALDHLNRPRRQPNLISYRRNTLLHPLEVPRRNDGNHQAYQLNEPERLLLLPFSLPVLSDARERVGILRNGNLPHDEPHGDGHEPQQDRGLPLLGIQGMGLGEISAVLHDAPLRQHREQDDGDEHGTLGHFLEGIKPISNVPRIELVEDLAIHERIENDGEVMAAPVLAVEDLGTVLEEEHEEGELVSRLDEDVPPHGTVDEAGVALVWTSVEELEGGGFGAEGKGSHGVHDEVHPEHHHRVEGRLVPCHGGQEGDGQRDDVHGELELEELADVVKDRAAPQDGLDDRRELVVHNDNITRVLGHVRPTNAHGQPDVRRLERRPVVGAIARHSHHLADAPSARAPLLLVPRQQIVLLLLEIPPGVDLEPLLLVARHEAAVETLDEEVLVLWGRPGEDLKAGEDLVQLCRGELAEIFANHGESIVGQYSRLLGNCPRRIEIVPRDHPHMNARPLARRHRLHYVVPQGISDAHERVEAHVLLGTRGALRRGLGRVDDTVDGPSVGQGDASQRR